MVHGIRPDVPDSPKCVKKSFLMNTDHLGSFFTARARCWSVCLAGLRQHRLFYCLLWDLSERSYRMSEFPPMTAKAAPVPTHIKATWLKKKLPGYL